MSVNFSDYLYYDETSPSAIRWKNDVYYGRYKTMLKAHKDSPAGSIDADGYWQIKINGKCYKVHRIICILNNIDVHGLQVDHVNGVKNDNRMSNLRAVCAKTNSRNRKMQSNNTTGFTGVVNCGSSRYRAQYVDLNGVTKSKHFSIKVLGKDEAFRQAVEFRDEMLKILKDCGENYTDRHGLQEMLK